MIKLGGVTVLRYLLLLGILEPTLAVPAAEQSEAERAAARVVALSLASPYKIPAIAILGHIRYRFTLPNGVDWQFPETGEQHVSVQGNEATLDICQTCGKEAMPTLEALEAAKAFNAYVDNSPAIHRLIRAQQHNQDRIMKALVLAVRERMNGAIDFVGYASASQAYAQRSGDCTEVAVLLAAAARSRGIPARVVYGWVYSSRFSGMKHHFSPHMWVQAWNGERWVSYDAGVGMFDAGHIALGLGNGTPEEYQVAVQAQARLKLVTLVGVAAKPNQP